MRLVSYITRNVDHRPSFLLRLLGSFRSQRSVFSVGTVVNLLNSIGNVRMKAPSFVTFVPNHDLAVRSVEVFIDLVFQLVMNFLIAS